MIGKRTLANLTIFGLSLAVPALVGAQTSEVELNNKMRTVKNLSDENYNKASAFIASAEAIEAKAKRAKRALTEAELKQQEDLYKKADKAKNLSNKYAVEFYSLQNQKRTLRAEFYSK